MPRYNLLDSPAVAHGMPTAPVICDVDLVTPPTGDEAGTQLLRVTVDGATVQVDVLDVGPPLLVSIDGKPCEVIADSDSEYTIRASASKVRVVTAATSIAGSALTARELRAPMPGRVVKVLCKAGDVVERGAPLVVLEAMKMENELVAPAAGRIGQVLIGEGNTVEARATLLTFAEA